MSKPIWKTSAGFLGTVTQRTAQSISLVTQGIVDSFSVVTGQLPLGLVLDKITERTTVTAINPLDGTTSIVDGTVLTIRGNPTGVPDVVTSKFTLRAKNSEGIADRTFSIDVEGPVKPMWVTDGGFLDIGTTGEYFAVNKELIDYQLVAEPNVLFPNQKMRYFIGDGEGQLPIGLELSESGRITGIIAENLTIDTQSVNLQGYDSAFYDVYPYDIIGVENNLINTQPRFYTKIYKFYVTATDGYSSEKRLFFIQLFDANSLRADTSYITADSAYFANDGYLFSPTWLSPANLGSRRASNYQIIDLKVYDPFPELGPVTFDWEFASINPEIRALGDSPGDIYGAQTRNRLGDTVIYLKSLTSLPVPGQYLRLDSYIEGADSTEYEIVTVTDTGNNTCELTVRYNPRVINQQVFYDSELRCFIENDTQIYLGSKSNHPMGFKLDSSTGALYGKIPYIPAYSIDYRFTIRTTKIDSTDVFNQKTVKSDRIFNLKLRGDVDSTIKWVTDSLVGNIKTGYQSELFVKAEHTDNSIDIQYTLIGGSLPETFELKRDGTIVGKLSYDTGLTYIDFNTDFKLDGGDTTIDRRYDFVIRANDIYRLSAIDKSFYIIIDENNKTPFSSIYVRPFLTKYHRKLYRDFIENKDIFDHKILYRGSDSAFGLQDQIKMTIEFGIQRLNLSDYVYALQNYFYNKRFYFGDVAYAVAKDSHGNSIYEIVYVKIVDDLENINGKTPDHVTVLVNQQLKTFFVNSLDNWQAALESITIDDNTIEVDEYLRPRYMRTIQENGQPLGFVKAVPLCYVQPGNGATVVRKIELSGFDFKLFDFEVDRLIIDNTLDSPGDKYLKFPIDKITSEVDQTTTLPPNILAGSDGIILLDEDGNELLIDL